MEDDILIDATSGEIIDKPELTQQQTVAEDTEPNAEQRDTEQRADDDDHDDDDQDDNRSQTDVDPEREAIRERRRQERRERKQAAREREDTFRREIAARDSVIDEMRRRLEVVERSNSGAEMAQIQQAQRQAESAYAYHKDQIRIATESGNGAAVAEATENMLRAQQRINDIKRVEQALKQRQQQPTPLDPRVGEYARNWTEANKWFDPTGRDMDSKIAMQIDQQLASEGWVPNTKEYWDELSARVKKYLPHRAERGTVTSTKPKSVVQGSGRDGRGAATVTTAEKAGYRLSKERVSALKEAGLWDDPKKRAEAVKRFQEYDKQHNNG